jgi:hypothetical protein
MPTTPLDASQQRRIACLLSRGIIPSMRRAGVRRRGVWTETVVVSDGYMVQMAHLNRSRMGMIVDSERSMRENVYTHSGCRGAASESLYWPTFSSHCTRAVPRAQRLYCDVYRTRCTRPPAESAGSEIRLPLLGKRGKAGCVGTCGVHRPRRARCQPLCPHHRLSHSLPPPSTFYR